MVECLTTATGVLDYWHKTFFGFFPIYLLWQHHWSHLSLSYPLSLLREVNRKGILYILQSSCQRCRLKLSCSAFKVIITPRLIQLKCPKVDFVCPPGSWQTDHNVDCLRDYRNTWIAMSSSSQPGVQFWRGTWVIIQILIPTPKSSSWHFKECLLLQSAGCSAVSRMRNGRESLSGCFSSKLPPLMFFSYLHQGASGYQQPGPCRPQVHHEVERPLAAGASSRGGAGGLSKQRHHLPTERGQAAEWCLCYRWKKNKQTSPISFLSHVSFSS